jgi:PEP-CTERM motif
MEYLGGSGMLRQVSLITVLSLALGAGLGASPITVFPTGVDDSMNPIGNAGIDPHYVVMVSGLPQAVVVGGAPAYIQTPPSRWVWQTWQQQPSNVTLTFRTTFNLAAFLVGSTSLSGSWATDNLGLDILINGQSTGNTCGGFTSLCNFSITNGFVAGTNTIDFVVQDTGVVGGMLVSSLNGVTASIPEPSSLLLCGLGLVALAFRRVRI